MSLGRVHGDAPRVHRDLVSLSRRGRRRARPALVLLLPCALPFAAAHAQSTPAPEQAESALPTVTVTSDVPETASGPANGFVARRSATGTKTDTPLAETPQSVSVVTRDQLEAQGADSLDQAFGYTAGIYSLNGGAQRRISTGFTVRGFNITGSAPLYLNGSKFPINSLSGSMEPNNFERIELLKGPASILYGQAAPGGIINLVSKRPTAQPLREVELQAGSWNRRQASVDLGGPVTEDGRVRYRLSGLVRRSDSMIEVMPDDRTSLWGSLEWRISDRAQLTVLATYDKARSLYDYGKPLDGSLLPDVFGKTSRKLFVGEPGFDRFKTRGATLGYLFEYRLNDDWQFRQNLLGFDYRADNAYASISGRVSTSNPALVSRSAVTRFDTDRGLSLDNQLQGRLRHGQFEHTLLLGLDWSQRDFSRQQRLGTIAPLNIYLPVYGAIPSLGAANTSLSNERQTGFYVQDHIKWNERWIALLGGRYDQASGRGRAIAATGLQTGSQRTESHAFSPRLGLMYLFPNGLAPYYSYTRSFQPQSGTDFDLNPFEPTRGKQHEIGLKYEPPGVNASITVAAYELTQQNVLTSDPAHPGYSVQTGEIRSRGFEIEGRASLNRQLDLVGAITSTDARITASNQGNVGDRPQSVPRHMASLWADYRVQAVPGLSVGLGVRNVGPQEVNRIKVPSYTVVDAAIRYQWEKWQLALNIKNLADRTYLANCSYACFYGDERNFTFTARYAW